MVKTCIKTSNMWHIHCINAWNQFGTCFSFQLLCDISNSCNWKATIVISLILSTQFNIHYLYSNNYRCNLCAFFSFVFSHSPRNVPRVNLDWRTIQNQDKYTSTMASLHFFSPICANRSYLLEIEIVYEIIKLL